MQSSKTFLSTGVQSLGGQKLVSIGQLHIGSHVSKMMRLKTKALGKDEETAQYGCVMGKYR